MPDVPAAAVPVFPFRVAPLRYAYDALEPAIDRVTLREHHDRHHQAYVDRLNALLANVPALHGQSIESILRNVDAVPNAIRGAVRHEGGGHANHQFFWKILGRDEGRLPSGGLANAIAERFGDLVHFKAAFSESALNMAGDGWTFLVVDKPPHGPLEIVSLPGNESVLSIGKAGVLCCDLWEHGYAGQYGGNKAGWLEVFWDVVAWDVASRRFDGIRNGAKIL